MVRRDGAAVRKERIQEIVQRVMAWLEQNDGEIRLKKAVSALAFDFGLTKGKIMEYLGIAEDLDRFIIDSERDKIRKVTEEEAGVED